MKDVPDDTLQLSIDFIVNNIKIPKRDVDRARLTACVAEIENNAENGLHCSQLEKLAYKVVFNNSYDITIRRKILYCMVPVDEEFPYRIIPLAVSDAASVPVNPTWQFSILSWLGGLLEYCVIDNNNRFVHICYTAIINLASNLNVVLLVCKILSHLTTRNDVTPQRANFLIRLKEKAGFFEKVSQLLRLYQLYRPDLVVGKLCSRHLVQSAPRNLKIALLALRDRLQESQEREFGSSRGGIWGEINRAEKSNPYQRPTAIPQPDNNYYAETIEEKTNKIIFVSQYKSFSEITKGIPNSNRWKWPNNPASHLTRPEIIPLFRPHEQTVLVGLTNWLEIALRTELVDGIGNPSKQRCEKLLKSVYSLVKVTNAHIPVVNRFLAEYMTIWDQNSHFDIVLSLLECVTYSSPDFVSVTLLKLLGELLDHAALYKWCRIMETVSNTASSWAVRAHEESHRTEDYFNWTCGLEENLDGAIMGLWFLTYRLEHFFLVALIEFKCHPMVVHQILDYYVKINMVIEELNLPAVFAPPVLITAAIITHSDLATVHRLGKHLSSLPAAFKKLRNKNTSGVEKDVQTECLSMGESVNQSVSLFLTAVCSASAFGKAFRRALDPFFSFDHLQKMLGAQSVKRYASVIHALPYIPFFAKRNVDKEKYPLDSEEREEMIKQVIAELKDHGFSGINECQNAYKVK